MSIFDSVTLTFDLKQHKPSTKLFEDALSKLKTRPFETVYIDDLSNTIEVAKSLGIHGILYTNHDSLIRSLQNQGIRI